MRATRQKLSRATLAPLRHALLAAPLLSSALSARPQEAGVSAPAPASPALDSLSVRLIDIAIARARLEVSQSDLWHRLMPRITLSGSVGTGAVLTDDPPYGITTAHGACRLTVTIALSEIPNASRHSLALLELTRLECERDIARTRAVQRDSTVARRLCRLRAEIRVLDETLTLKRRLFEFYRLRFDQGTGSYAEVSRAEIECLELEARRDRLRLDINELEGAFR